MTKFVYRRSLVSNTYLDVISLPKAAQQNHPCRCGATKRGSAACLNQLHKRLRMYNCATKLKVKGYTETLGLSISIWQRNLERDMIWWVTVRMR